MKFLYRLKFFIRKTSFYYLIINKLRIFAINKLYIKGYSWPICNINRDYTQNKQKKILLCYILEPLFSSSVFFHANYIHVNQIITCLIKLGFVVDICNYYDKESEFKSDYDYILGFGSAFKLSSASNPKAKKILFLTENHPSIVSFKMSERLSYLKERHNSFNFSNIVHRKGIYDELMFQVADYGILMNSLHNCSFIENAFKKAYQINVNAICNSNYVFHEKDFGSIKKHFVWFGSIGAIHKGLDLLIDVFSVLPQLTLNIYGLRREEIFFNPNRYNNIIIHDKVDVNSPAFLEEVVSLNTFCILPSCSEAMSSGIATCMSHGLIPIITKETGFDAKPFIFELDNFMVETISNKVIELSNLDDSQLTNLSKDCYEYSKKAFSISNFASKFESIMLDIIHEQ